MEATIVRKKGWLIGNKFVPHKSGAAFECYKLYGRPRYHLISISMMSCWVLNPKSKLYTDITPDATPTHTDITPDAIPMQIINDPADYLFLPYNQ